MKFMIIINSFLCFCVIIGEKINKNEIKIDIPFSKVSQSKHTNNWAVLVSTSKFWFNYRHNANTLSLYRTVKRLGISDSNIILMLSDDIACNPRNLFSGSVFNNMDHAIDLYGESIEVDYRGHDVTVENFIRLLTNRWNKYHPKSKRLLSDENSNIFIYLTGHGGKEFLKFLDIDEINSHDLANAFSQMYEKKRYNEIFFMIDTCQANTMYERITSPNILAIGSSNVDESSYSHHSDMDLGVAVIDRFTYFALEFLEKIEKNSSLTIDKLFEVFTFRNIHSTSGHRKDLIERNIEDILITDFFANIQKVYVDSVKSIHFNNKENTKNINFKKKYHDNSSIKTSYPAVYYDSKTQKIREHRFQYFFVFIILVLFFIVLIFTNA